MTVKSWRTISSKIAFQSKWYTLRQDTVELPDGRVLDDYYVSVRPDIVMIFCVTIENKVVLVRQYKQGVQQITLELPAGTFKDESPFVAAERELLEETGYVCEKVTQVGKIFDDSSKNSNFVHIFLGINARLDKSQNLDPNEKAGGIDIELVSITDVLGKIRSGEIAAQSSVVSIYRALDELQFWKP